MRASTSSPPLPQPIAEVELGSRASPGPSWEVPPSPIPPPPPPRQGGGERVWVPKSPGGRGGGERGGHRGAGPLPSSRSGRTPRQLASAAAGETFPRAERRARNLLGARCLPGGGGGGGASRDRLARGGRGARSGLGARGSGLGLGRPRAAPRWIARRCVRPAAWSPGVAGGSCSRPPARRPHLPAAAPSLPRSRPHSLPSPNLLPFSLQPPPPPPPPPP